MLNWANIVTISRILFVIIIALLFNTDNFVARVIAFFLIILTIFLDYVDGKIARKFKFVTSHGSLFDITADRIVEIILWMLFSFKELVSIYVPIIILVRGLLTDFIRATELKKGITPFHKDAMGSSKFAQVIVSSRISRGLYGTSKVIVFSYIALIYALNISTFNISQTYFNIGWWLSIYIVIFNLIRAIPVLYYGTDLLFKK